MRKRNIAIVIILISVILLLLAACVSLPRSTTGPLVIVVTDNETGLPLSDITVYYQLQKARPIFFIETRHINIELQKLETDRNGEITIPAKRYLLRLDEQFSNKSIYINLDTKDNRTPRDMDYYFLGMFFGNRRENNIILVDSNYYATGVFIWNAEERKETTKFSNGFFKYDIETPFYEKEEMRISVKLARNTD